MNGRAAKSQRKQGEAALRMIGGMLKMKQGERMTLKGADGSLRMFQCVGVKDGTVHEEANN